MTTEKRALSEVDVVAIMTEMISARVYSTRLFNLQRQGQIGTMAPVDGHEATIVGAAAALDPATDWVAPQYREPVGLGRYGPDVLERILLYNLGHPAGGHIPAPTRVLPPQISLATQIPHAVGIAWGMKAKGEEGVALVFFGDGSSSEGDFYEAGNMAGVLRAPVIFVCVNNGWAISTPNDEQTAAASFADKALGFGFPGIAIDGNDAYEVHAAVAAARERAIAGKGPTLIEARCYRLGPHTTADDPTRYVPESELAAARVDDPIERLRSDLAGRGLWSDDDSARVESEAMERFDAAWAKAKATPLDPAEMLDHVFATPTPRQRRQQAELRARLAGC